MDNDDTVHASSIVGFRTTPPPALFTQVFGKR